MGTEDFTGRLAGGMTVRSADGHRVGVLLNSDRPGEFIVEKGLFFTRDYRATMDDILDVREGDVILRTELKHLERIHRSEVPHSESADSTAFGGRAVGQPDIGDRARR